MEDDVYMKQMYEVILNFRDLGGYQSSDGRNVKRGMIYRGSTLCDLTEEGLEMLKQLHLSYVIDFRCDEERNKKADVELDGVINLHRSALHAPNGEQNFNFMAQMKKDSSPRHLKELYAFIEEGYRIMPFHNEAYQCVFQLLKQHKAPLMFHCSAGKDRTGIMAALILKTLGVDWEQIMEDYLLSNYYLHTGNQNYLNQFPLRDDVKEIAGILVGVQSYLLEMAFQEIENHYPDFEDYLEKEMLVTRAEIIDLRNYYLDGEAKR